MVDQTSRMNRPSAGTDPTSHILAFGQSLQMTQWLTPQELESYRAPLIAKLLRHARKNATYYQGKIDVDLSSPEHIKKNWRHLPIIARAEVAQHRFKFLSRNSVREGGPITAGETSGSTGVPLAFQ